MNKVIASKVFRTIAGWPSLRLIMFQFSIPWKENRKFLFGWKIELIKSIESFVLLQSGQIIGFF